MVQRPGGADFAPGAWVFPGGTVIEDDRSFEDELRAAAVREVFEEVGILLASDAGDAECMWVGRELRRGISFSGSMHKAGLAPDFGALVIFARWVTPALLRRRFDTRFYFVPMPEGQTVRPQESEVSSWQWVTPARALTDPAITLVYATRAVLESVAVSATASELFARARGLTDIPIVEPRLVHTTNGWEVVRA